MIMELGQIPRDALPIEAFKAHLRLGTTLETNGLQDEVLAGFLSAAIHMIEARTSKVMLLRGCDLRFEGWPDAYRVALPVAPVVALVRCIITAQTGAERTIDPADLIVRADGHRPELRAKAGPLPFMAVGDRAVVTVTAGYGDWANVPADLAQAVMLLAAHYYEYRHDTAYSAGCMPFGVTSLIERYRTLRIGGAA